jgi:hypothetical protein
VDHAAQALEMDKSLKARENTLWSAQSRLGMTKRTANCKCSITLSYSTLLKKWSAHVRCNVHVHTEHGDAKLPAPVAVPSTVGDLLNHLKKTIGVSVKQQLDYCAENGLEVTQAFIRRLNSSPAADDAFGLSGDSGLLFVLLNMKKHVNFCVQMELTDAANKCHQLVTVACVGQKFVHVQGGKLAPDPTRLHYEGLDTRFGDTELNDFYDFLVSYLIRIPGLRCTVRNCVWSTQTDLKYLAAHPRVQMFDTTCKTNIKNKHFGYGSGVTTDHEWFKSFSFFLESLQKQDFFWLWSVGTPAIIDESIRSQLQQVVTDGDDNMVDAIKGAFDADAWGTPQVLCRRCTFHLLNLNFEKYYTFFTCDGGVGLKCRDWLKLAGKKCKTKEEMLDAGEKIITFIREHADDGNFTNIARERLLQWVQARLMHTEQWCRYAFNHLQCFDIETTSPAEGAHQGLKSDPQIHSHCELAMLVLSDLRRTKQLYFESERAAQARQLEEATNVKTVVETMLHKNFCLSTAKDVILQYIQSVKYEVFKARPTDDPSVVGLVVCTAPPIVHPDPAPFQLSRVHKIMKVGGRLLCDCAAQRVHGRPCRHLLKYNEGLVDKEDFAHFHTKKYLVTAYDAPVFAGVVDRAPTTRELPDYIMPSSQDTGNDNGDDGDNGDGDAQHQLKKKRSSRPYNECEREMKRVLVKWGNHPSILKEFCNIITRYDNELGPDVSAYKFGRGSSKPTPQGSRSK